VKIAFARDVYDFLALCASRHPLLVQLTLNLIHTVFFNPFNYVLAEEPPATLETLHPVLSLQRLREFVFRYDTQLQLSEKDLEIFASTLPKLRVLMLNNSPGQPDTPVLSVYAVRPFVKYCHELEELGLYIDGESTPTSLLQEGRYSRPNLTLDFGSSPITPENAEQIALALSGLFESPAPDLQAQAGYRDLVPTACSFSANDEEEEEWKRASTSPFKLWGRVNDLLGTLVD